MSYRGIIILSTFVAIPVLFEGWGFRLDLVLLAAIVILGLAVTLGFSGTWSNLLLLVFVIQWGVENDGHRFVFGNVSLSYQSVVLALGLPFVAIRSRDDRVFFHELPFSGGSSAAIFILILFSHGILVLCANWQYGPIETRLAEMTRVLALSTLFALLPMPKRPLAGGK